jgi:hypothetical protein
MNDVKANPLSASDKFEILEQLNLHQRYIDNDASLESAQKYQSLYWPEAKFTVNDIRQVTFEGFDGMKQMYDFAHSVFPIHKMRHSLGTFVISGSGNEAFVEWHWIVSWREDDKGTLSTGIYLDTFQKRDGIWKCLERRSDVDKNWPASVFQVWLDKTDETFKTS